MNFRTIVYFSGTENYEDALPPLFAILLSSIHLILADACHEAHCIVFAGARILIQIHAACCPKEARSRLELCWDLQMCLTPNCAAGLHICWITKADWNSDLWASVPVRAGKERSDCGSTMYGVRVLAVWYLGGECCHEEKDSIVFQKFGGYV